MNPPPPSAKALFLAAINLPSDARRAFLHDSCGPDEVLRGRVEALLAAHERAATDHRSPDGPEAATAALVPAPDRESRAFGLEVGTMIGPYALREQVGEGGMGLVFVAEQTEPVRRKVALKVIKPGMDSRQVVARFEAERQALALMDHPNIAKVLDGGTTPEGRPFFVMELVRGEPVTDYCDRHQLGIRPRLELFLQVCRAVRHAHQKGVIHRDLKPSNILVAVHDIAPVVKVIDFGIAKAVGQPLTDRTVYTGLAQMIGTPLYMSPEQAGQSALDVDTRTDVYSLGVLLYELLTGTTPVDPDTFRRAGLDEVRRVIREDEPPRPSARLSTLARAALSTVADRRAANPQRLAGLVRGELDWVVMKCLEKDRDRRYESAAALAADVERYLADEPVQAAPPSARYRLRKFVRRNRRGVLTAAVVALALLAGTAVSVWQALEADAARRDAEREAAVAKATNDFIRHLLSEASPDKNARNQKVTVEQVLQRAAARIPTELAGQPRVEAAIRLTIGESLLELGQAEAAMPHLERAAELRRRELGPDHADTLEAELSVAFGHHARGQFERAEQLGAAALAACRRVLGDDHPHTLTGMNNQALVCQELGRNDEAERLFVEGLAGSRRVKGEAHRETLTTAYNLAQFYLAFGRPAEAEPLLRQVLDASRTGERPETMLTFAATNGLAELYSQRNEKEKAEGLFREAVAIARRVVGDDHPFTAAALHNQGTALFEREQFAEAEPFLVEALAISRRFHEPGHPDLVPVLESAASVFLALEKTPQAVVLLVELIDLKSRKRVGPVPGGLTLEFVRVMLDEALNAMELQAKFEVIAAKRYDAAASLLEEVVRIRRKIDGPDHPKTYDAIDELVSICVTAKRPEKAVPLLETILKQETERLGRKHSRTVVTVAQLGRCYRDVGRIADALPLLREACDAYPPNTTQWRTLSGNLLQTYVKAGRNADAVAFGKSLAARVRREERPAVVAVATHLHMNGKTLLEAGAYIDAEAMLRQSLSLVDLLPNSGMMRSQMILYLGAALAAQGKNEEAEKLLLSAFDQLATAAPAMATLVQPRLRDVVTHLIRLYEATNRPEKVREWTAKLPREVAPRPRLVQ